MQKIKTVIFDLSEVIINGYYGTENLIEAEKNISKEDFIKRKIQKNELFCDWMRGNSTEEFYFQELLKDTNWNITVEEIKLLARKNLDKQIVGTVEIIKKLKQKYKLVLLSDYTREWRDYILRTNKDLNLFDKKYFSCELGKIKSDLGTFQLVLDDLNIKPEETLFIDDSKTNVKIAENMGINCILFKDAKDLKANLKKLNILD